MSTRHYHWDACPQVVSTLHYYWHCHACPQVVSPAYSPRVQVNSLLTSQALHAHPLANPVVPLTANGVAAAHAAAEVLHIDEVPDTLTIL